MAKYSPKERARGFGGAEYGLAPIRSILLSAAVRLEYVYSWYPGGPLPGSVLESDGRSFGDLFVQAGQHLVHAGHYH